MSKTCILILSILVMGCCSVPMQRTRRQPETATEISEEKALSLEKLELDETFDLEKKDKQDSLPAADELVESDKEKVGDDKNNYEAEKQEEEKIEEETKEPKIEQIDEAKESSVPEVEKEYGGDKDEQVVEPKGVEELYQESKAEYEKYDKQVTGEEEISVEKKEEESKPGSTVSDNEVDDELQSVFGNDAPGGMFSRFSQMWQTVTTLGSSWDHWRRIFHAVTALAGF